MRGGPAPALVLVHSPLIGEATWHPVAEVLRARGHMTIVPALSAAFACPAPYYPRLAAAAADEIRRHARDGRLVLVGHSGAGALLPAIADAATAAATATTIGMIFVDALLPHPGHDWFGTVPEELADRLRGLARDDGLLPPWDEWFPPGTVDELLPDPHLRARICGDLSRVPLTYFEEPAPNVSGPAPAHSAYLRLSDAYEPQARQAAREGWRAVTRRTSHHLAMLTEPQEVGVLLEELLDTLSAGPDQSWNGNAGQ